MWICKRCGNARLIRRGWFDAETKMEVSNLISVSHLPETDPTLFCYVCGEERDPDDVLSIESDNLLAAIRAMENAVDSGDLPVSEVIHLSVALDRLIREE